MREGLERQNQRKPVSSTLVDLVKGVMVLYVVHELGQAPVCVRLNVHQCGRVQRGHVAAQHGGDTSTRLCVLLRHHEQQRGQ